MNALILYDSQYGNTERIARVIADTVRESAEVQLVRVGSAHPVDLQGVDMLVVGCPTQGWRPTPTIRSFLGELSPEGLRSVAVALFDTRFRLPRWMTGSAAKVVASDLQEKGVSLLVVPESFFVRGTEGPLRDRERDRAAAWARTLIKEVEASRPEARQ